jgi:Peptidase family C25
MNRRIVSAICAISLAINGFCLVTEAHAQARSAPAATTRTVILTGNLTDGEFLRVSAASGDSVLLIDRPNLEAANLRFVQTFRPERVLPVGISAEKIQERPDLSGLGLETVSQDPLTRLPGRTTTTLVVCPAEPRSALLQATCLAAECHADLRICDAEGTDVANIVGAKEFEKVFAVGAAVPACARLWPGRVTQVADASAVATAHLRLLRQAGPIRTLIVANPADMAPGKGRLSSLAPWVAHQKHAGLVLTNEDGTDVATVVEQAARQPDLAQLDTLILLANLHAIPMEKRPNPAPGKDTEITLEPLTPRGTELFSYAIGRLFHEEPGMIPLMLAREKLLPKGPTPRKALLVSNPGGGLSMLESISRNTAKEFHNRGYQATALFNNEVNPEKLRSLMPEQDIFLWEGHYRTMVDRYGMPKWNEPLPPSLVFLQSCLALNEAETRSLFDRGAIALVGSPTRTYSGSGGAFTLSFFDALLYEERSLGGALRQAKNFLMTYALLKEKRLGDGAKLAGANRRSAWAFTLWGDPTLQLPQPPIPTDALPIVRCTVRGESLTLTVPDESYPKVHTGEFETQLWPNARLAGLVTKNRVDDERRLVPMLYAEVALPKAPAGKTPRLSSRLPEDNWVFAWDARRQTGYLLALPRARDREQIRFQIHWEDNRVTLDRGTLLSVAGLCH